MSTITPLDLLVLAKGAESPFVPEGPEKQACHKMEIRGLMRAKQVAYEQPFRGRKVTMMRWSYSTTDAGKTELQSRCDQ